MGKKVEKDLTVGRKFGRPDLERNGLFSEADYISVGEKYSVTKVNIREQKGLGRQLLTSPGKRGHFTKDVYFEKQFARVFEKEACVDTAALKRKERLQETSKNVSNAPFKPGSTMPLPSGKGSIYGTIEHQWPVITKEIDLSKFPEKKAEAKKEIKANFVTKPPKKGGLGYPNIGIGESFEYQSDPYDRKKEKDFQYEQEAKKKILSKPFVTSQGNQEFFNKFTTLSSGMHQSESSNSDVEDKEAKGKPGKKRGSTVKKEGGKESLVPFKPPSNLTGHCINKYPVYEAPKEGRRKNEVLQLLEDDEKRKRYTGPKFKPSSTPKSYPIKSVIDSNVPKRMPDWIRKIVPA